MPGSTGKKLSDYFRSKNPDLIAEGMRSIVAEQADVVDDMLSAYKNDDLDRDLDAQQALEDSLMKGMNSLFGNANKLHALVKPRENAGININFGINAGTGSSVSISQAEPRELAAEVMRELERANPGVEITDEMVRNALIDMQRGQAAIEGSVIDDQ